MRLVKYTRIRSNLCWHWVEYLPDGTSIYAMCLHLYWAIIGNHSGAALYSYQTYNWCQQYVKRLSATQYLFELGPAIVFADDILICANTPHELQQMLQELADESKIRVWIWTSRRQRQWWKTTHQYMSTTLRSRTLEATSTWDRYSTRDKN